MSSALAPADWDRLTDRLVKILELLGSDKIGESSNAGVAAHRLVKKHGLMWSDIVKPPHARQEPTYTPPPDDPRAIRYKIYAVETG